jgi:hypothetical protein
MAAKRRVNSCAQGHFERPRRVSAPGAVHGWPRSGARQGREARPALFVGLGGADLMASADAGEAQVAHEPGRPGRDRLSSPARARASTSA